LTALEKIKKSKRIRGKKGKDPRVALGLKRKTRLQFAAICYRKIKSGCEVLLITSRDSGRWVIPKGWPIDGLSPSGTAAQEAWEEGGVRGKVRDTCLGIFAYDKAMETGTDLPVSVAVYPLRVDSRLADKFPEVGQRKRKWFSPKKAATRVNEPELKRMLKKFDPKSLR